MLASEARGAPTVSLARTSLLNSIAVMARVASALAVNKILAVLVGPAGYALVGQLQSVLSIVASAAGGALGTGVTKGTAEHFDDPARQHALWRSAVRLSLGAGVVAVLVVSALDDAIARLILHDEHLSHVLLVVALAVPAIAANAIFLAILNGKKAVSAYVAASVCGSALSVAIIGGLTAALGIQGALIGVVASPALAVAASAVLISRMSWFRFSHLWGPSSVEARGELSKYAFMALTSAACAALAQLTIRNHLAEAFGWHSAGLVQAVWKVSEIYLSLITAPLVLYYLPRVAEIRRTEDLAAEIWRAYRFALPVTAAGALAIYLCRDLLVRWLFAPEFSPMTELLAWQVAGDVIRIASWLLAYVLIGRAATGTFVSLEIAFSASLVLLTYLLTARFGLQGVPLAYLANYVLYLVALTVAITRLRLLRNAP